MPAVVPNGGSPIAIDVNTTTILIEPANNVFGLFALAGLPSQSFSEGALPLYVNVLRLAGTAGPSRVFYSTGANDTAVAGLNYDLTLNPGETSTSTSGWLDFADGQNSSSIIVRFHNNPHNSTNSTGFVGLSLLISNCQTFDPVQNAYVATAGCTVDVNNNFEALTILDECSYILCENGGFCYDSGTATASCVCPAGFQGQLCQSGTATTAEPGHSTGVIAGSTWILPVVICGGVLVLFVLGALLYTKRWRKKQQAKFNVAATASSTFANPLYDSSAATQKVQMSSVHDGGYTEAEENVNYADVPGLAPYSDLPPSGDGGVCCTVPCIALDSRLLQYMDVQAEADTPHYSSVVCQAPLHRCRSIAAIAEEKRLVAVAAPLSFRFFHSLHSAAAANELCRC